MERSTDKTLAGIAKAEAEMRRGLVEFCVLLTIAREEVYASDILAELKQAGVIVVEGTLYPLLSRLRSEGLVSYSWRESSGGPPRKYYTLTREGKQSLEQLLTTWKKISGSVSSLVRRSQS